jgi:hypothetical protein
MLGLEIKEFIEALKVQQVIGCILIPEKDIPTLQKNLKEAGIGFGDISTPNSLRGFLIRMSEDLILAKAPGILILSEERYSKDPELAKEVREKASYFMNVSGSRISAG